MNDAKNKNKTPILHVLAYVQFYRGPPPGYLRALLERLGDTLKTNYRIARQGGTFESANVAGPTPRGGQDALGQLRLSRTIGPRVS